MPTVVRTVLVAIACLVLVGCATGRLAKLERKADRVESALLREQRKVVASAETNRQARLDHLTQLRATLSAANVGRGIVPHAIPPEQRDVAYDVLDEVYDTIEWNIPLGPGDAQMRALPSQFQGGVLRLR
jgi:hypothetical protein